MNSGQPEEPRFDSDAFAARRALARRRRRRRLRRSLAMGVVGLAGLGVVAGLGAGGTALFTHLREHSGIFRLRQVDVGRTQWVPPWEIADAMGVAPGDDFLDISPETVRMRVEENPWVLKAEVKKTLGWTLRVEVTERSPVAVWLGMELLEVAGDGTVLGPAPRRPDLEWPVSGRAQVARGLALPLITGVEAGELRPGDVIQNPGAREALAFLSRLNTYGQPGEEWLSEVWVGKPGDLVAVTLDGGIAVRVGDGMLTPRKVRALRSVLDRLHGEETPPSLVDARFRHQVIVKTG